ncbi:MAG: hypothetical protein JST59_02870 [Actinobacteria bacterium]|nr:hypothetical protein [Actinomycetota bacterium]
MAELAVGFLQLSLADLQLVSPFLGFVRTSFQRLLKSTQFNFELTALEVKPDSKVPDFLVELGLPLDVHGTAQLFQFLQTGSIKSFVAAAPGMQLSFDLIELLKHAFDLSQRAVVLVLEVGIDACISLLFLFEFHLTKIQITDCFRMNSLSFRISTRSPSVSLNCCASSLIWISYECRSSSRFSISLYLTVSQWVLQSVFVQVLNQTLNFSRLEQTNDLQTVPHVDPSLTRKLRNKGLLDIVGVSGLHDVPKELTLLRNIHVAAVAGATARRIKRHYFYLQTVAIQTHLKSVSYLLSVRQSALWLLVD